VRDDSRRMKEHHRAMLRRNDVCHLCGHPGSDAIDHVVPLKPRPGQPAGTDTDDNKAPAHHNVECPTCGIKCNRVKSNKPAEKTAVIRRSGSLAR
jgi:5-methylcytosine-specific restriction endonuclease McrA